MRCNIYEAFFLTRNKQLTSCYECIICSTNAICSFDIKSNKVKQKPKPIQSKGSSHRRIFNSLDLWDVPLKRHLVKLAADKASFPVIPSLIVHRCVTPSCQ